MTVLAGGTLADAGFDAVALKPTEVEVTRAAELAVETLTVDYEGRAHVPDAETLAALATDRSVRVTAPVRADGYDPRGDDRLLRALPEAVGLVAVAGHGAYLDAHERRRAVAPRLSEVAARGTNPWLGTEGVERVALAVGGTQYEVYSSRTTAEVRALRAAGFDGGIAVYAPTVLAENDDVILDAVGDYAARRPDVETALPEETPTDSRATGTARATLLEGCREYALVGSLESVRERIDRLRGAGVDHVVGYPARGLDPFLG